MIKIVYRVKDPKTGLFWNNILRHGTKFVSQENAHTWHKETQAIERARNYLQQFNDVSLRGVMEHLPTEVDVVTFQIQETEQNALRVAMTPANVFISKVKSSKLSFTAISACKKLSTRHNFKDFRYLVEYSYVGDNSTSKWTWASRGNELTGKYLNEIVAGSRGKSFIRFGNDIVFAKGDSELMFLKMHSDTRFDHTVYDLLPYYT